MSCGDIDFNQHLENVINEHGEREELKITFELKSQRQPKREKDETLWDEQQIRNKTRKE